MTIACVSNEVGGDLVGNAKWTGVRLTDVLDMAGVQPGATQIVAALGRRLDGGFPTEWVTAPDRPRDALIAVKMNDEPLPAAHGFPARLIVPGLYGYVSATKWLAEIELTTLEAFDAYWVPRGWAKEAPILTQSRIDVPGRTRRVAAGHGRGRGRGVGARPRDRRRSRCGSTRARGSDATIATAIRAADLGPVAVRLGTATGRATTRSTSARRTAPARSRRTGRRRPAPDGARGYHRIAVSVG